ncbi:unnamed protein product [Larinioides sclopetarius]|uniref:Uncharacterized protein n=1 Tax=Larinioides sclopetarius TaxID=280406 RepID=A0AAV2BG03_9ARAC
MGTATGSSLQKSAPEQERSLSMNGRLSSKELIREIMKRVYETEMDFFNILYAHVKGDIRQI